ncbi:MAG TPA: hypothetical protein QGI39_07625, partial [Gammaproteobacteria bacterium]|nr:hypothetical protein [Gammaproteobacteria bacterium]
MQFTEQNLLAAFREGTLTFAYGISVPLFLLFVILIVVGVWFSYRTTTRPVAQEWKTFLVGIRSAVLVILLFCLLRPVITTLQVSPQETYLGLLIDDSQSMSIEDLAGRQSRQSAVEELIFENGLLEELEQNFQ